MVNLPCAFFRNLSVGLLCLSDIALIYATKLDVFAVVALIVGVATMGLLPKIAFWLGHESTSNWLLILAGACFMLAPHVPDQPFVYGLDSRPYTHMLGVGAYSGLVWWWMVKDLGWRLLGVKLEVVRVAMLLGLVSIIGAGIEVAEGTMYFVANITTDGLTPMDGPLDLAANLCGAGIVLLAVQFYQAVQRFVDLAAICRQLDAVRFNLGQLAPRRYGQYSPIFD